MASIAAHQLGDTQKERDCLTRGRACGVNTGRFEAALTRLGANQPPDPEELGLRLAERIWGLLDNWGWVGAGFKNKIADMLNGLSASKHKQFHLGLDYLGHAVGAVVTRSAKEGAPVGQGGVNPNPNRHTPSFRVSTDVGAKRPVIVGGGPAWCNGERGCHGSRISRSGA